MSVEDNDRTCPSCETPIEEALAAADVYVCACQSFIFIRPMNEWFARWLTIRRGTEAMLKADPELAQRIVLAKRASEN